MEKILFDAMPEAVKQLLNRLETAGFEAYAVGGCVRDVLMGRTVHDWDLCSAANPQEVMKLFADCKVLPTGIEHGTVTVVFEGVPYELTMFRAEEDYDGRKPNIVRPVRTISEDLKRRDFTVNAMAYSPKHGMIDLYGGRNDLLGKIRAVGKAEERFREDYLRILRGLRFSSCYGLSIESDTAEAMRTCAGGLSILSGERVWQELSRLLLGQNAGQVLAEFADVLQKLSVCWESFSFSISDGQKLDSFPESLSGRLAFLLWQIGENREQALHELRCTSELKRHVQLIWKQSLSICEGQLPQKWLSEFPAETRAEDAENALILAGEPYKIGQMKVIMDSKIPMETRELALNGGDLVKLGVVPGPKMGGILKGLLEAVWCGEVENEKTALAAYLKKDC